MKRKVLVAAVVLIALYAAICGLACVSYRTLLYPAPGGVAAGPSDHLLEAATSDGTKAHAYDYTEPTDAAVVVFFHGNGETAENGIDLAQTLRARGIGTVLAEYRGYGASRNGSKPNEPGLYADAIAVLDALEKKGVGAQKIVLVGYSLGTGVASEMALRGRGRALVLIAPFTSIPAVAGRHAPMLPTSILIGDKFDTLSKASKIDLPTTVVHGTDDGVVPFDMGERLSKSFPHAMFVPIPGGAHADLFAVANDRLIEAIVSRTAL
jgi:hypothetical protein